MIRNFVVGNIVLAACLVWRVHHGGSIESTIRVGFIALVLGNGALAINLFLTKDRPKAATLERFPWRQWRKSHAVGIGLLVLIALQGYGAADLASFAILAFGVGNFLMVAFWLWDKHALRRHARSGQQSI